jgi:hypothetical protein
MWFRWLFAVKVLIQFWFTLKSGKLFLDVSDKIA